MNLLFIINNKQDTQWTCTTNRNKQNWTCFMHNWIQRIVYHQYFLFYYYLNSKKS